MIAGVRERTAGPIRASDAASAIGSRKAAASGWACGCGFTGVVTGGAPWGDDEQGTAFHKAYAPHVKRIEQSADILAQGLASIHEAMVDMADGHIDNEDLVRSMFSKITVKGQGGDAGK
ncbi:hypothetical protein [Streptomyces sp. NPDC048527]|uniref:hypothetical protein n=1 Tax=Streptomyces sp. NPDC048527 TaxID=3365568 RepID=UPI00371E6127